MQEDKPKPLLSNSVIVAAVIIFLMVFSFGTLCILNIDNFFNVYRSHVIIPVFRWLVSPLGLLTIFGFDAAWVIRMKFWSSKDRKTKFFLTFLVFALSASFFACWLLSKVLADLTLG